MRDKRRIRAFCDWLADAWEQCLEEKEWKK